MTRYINSTHRPALFLFALLLCSCAQLPPTEVPLASQTQRQAVVFDIDGTLTPQIGSVFEPRPDAARALNMFAAKGYRIVYLTARVPIFQAGLPDWLTRNGFPQGDLHVAQNGEQRSQPDKFKARILNEYIQRGWFIAYAYGDASTDFRAYAGAGIPRERIFALKRQGARNCDRGDYRLCLDGWSENLPFIEEVPRAK